MSKSFWLYITLLLLVGIINIMVYSNFGFWEPWETHYSRVTQEMSNRDTWIYPYYRGKPFLDKPPLLFWVERLGWSIWGQKEWSGRFFVSLISILGVLLFFIILGSIFNKELGFLSSFILLCAPQFVTLSKMVMFDPLFTVFSMLSLASFLKAISEYYKKGKFPLCWSYLIYIFAGFAFLSKAFLSIVIIGGSIFFYLLFNKELLFIKKLKLVQGTTLFLIISLPWVILMYLKFGSEFVDLFIVEAHIRRFLGKLTTVVTFKAPWTDYLYFIFVGLFPASLFLPNSFLFMLKKLQQGENDKILKGIFIFSLFIFTFFSISTTKFYHYILPVLPWSSIIVSSYILDFKNRIIEEAKLNRALYSEIILVVVVGVITFFDFKAQWRGFVDMFNYYYNLPVPENVNFFPYIIVIFIILGLSILFIVGKIDCRRYFIYPLMVAIWFSGLFSGNILIKKLTPHYSFKQIVATYDEKSKREKPLLEFDKWHRGILYYTDDNFHFIARNRNKFKQLLDQHKAVYVVVPYDKVNLFFNLVQEVAPSSIITLEDGTNYRLKLYKVHYQ